MRLGLRVVVNRPYELHTTLCANAAEENATVSTKTEDRRSHVRYVSPRCSAALARRVEPHVRGDTYTAEVPSAIIGHVRLHLLGSEHEESHHGITSEIIRSFELDWCSLIRQALNRVSPCNNVHEWNSWNFPYSSPELTIARCDDVALVRCHTLH